MSASPRRVVFDCNVFLQAMVSRNGAAAACLREATDRQVILYVSDYVLAEIRDLVNDLELVIKFNLSSERIERFISTFIDHAVLVTNVPQVYQHPYDPDDSHYVNLALACDARLVVSRDRDLLNLMDPRRPEGAEFTQRFPAFRVIEPAVLLRELRQSQEQQEP